MVLSTINQSKQKSQQHPFLRSPSINITWTFLPTNNSIINVSPFYHQNNTKNNWPLKSLKTTPIASHFLHRATIIILTNFKLGKLSLHQSIVHHIHLHSLQFNRKKTKKNKRGSRLDRKNEEEKSLNFGVLFEFQQWSSNRIVRRIEIKFRSNYRFASFILMISLYICWCGSLLMFKLLDVQLVDECLFIEEVVTILM